MPILKDYDGNPIEFPEHTHRVEHTVGQRLVGSASHPDDIIGFVYTNYQSGQMRGGMEEAQLGTRSIKVFYIHELVATAYGEISIQLGNIDINSKYVLYLEAINDENVSSIININNVKFSSEYPYNYNDDVQFRLNKINNLDEFGYNSNLWEVSFIGSVAPKCISFRYNISPNGTLMQTNFLRASFRKIEYLSSKENTAFVTEAEDGFMTIIDKADIDELYDQSFDMMERMKTILFVREPDKPIRLIDGATFNKALKSIGPNATAITFTKTAIPADKLANAVLISNENNNGKAYMYLDGATIYVSPENDNDTLTAAPLSAGMFLNCSTVTTINFTNFDTSNILLMNDMFSGCVALRIINGIKDFKTSNITDFTGIFYNCTSLTSLDLSLWDTIKVTKTRSMFMGCANLANLDISTWDTSNMIDMQQMFQQCTKLISSITITNSSITSYSAMFLDCSTASTAKFIVKYNGSVTKSIATKMIATKSASSNVSLPSTFSATVVNPDWSGYNGGSYYLLSNDGMTIKLSGEIGTVKYSWRVYKVHLDFNQGKKIVADKVFADNTTNRITAAQLTSIGLDEIDRDLWKNTIGIYEHDSLSGYVTVTNTTSQGTETQTIYVGEIFAKKYIPAQ